MYTGTETSKETQHISPHIAAHKSSLAPTSSAPTISSAALTGSGGPHDQASPHLSSHKGGLSAHIPTYRVGVHSSQHSVVKEIDHDGPLYLARHSHPANIATHLSKSTPQDLSSHASTVSEKAVPLELTPHTSHHKPLPHVHSVVTQGVSHSQSGPLMTAHHTDRGSAYFRVADSVIGVQGPSAILVSTVGDGGLSSQHTSQAPSLVHTQSSMVRQNAATNLTTMPATTMTAGVSLTTGSSPGVVTSQSQGQMMPADGVTTSNVSSACLTSQIDPRELKKEKSEQIEGIGIATGQGEGTQQTAGPQRDLVRQALQSVVTNPQHKTGNDQEVIEYNYTAGDIAELLMMNIQVNASLQAMKQGTAPSDSGSSQVVVLQPAAVDENTSLQPQPQTTKRRRPKLSEEAQSERRIRIALRMREKRAGETDEAKKVRRLREAERMRRKRATEDQEHKMRRRLEAAARARSRRANMTVEERVVDRQKAAERMRLRRATESDEAKAVRRLKAAERMRKRRANETPEQRMARRQNIAQRTKARRKRKGDETLNGEDSDSVSRNITTRVVKNEGLNNSLPHQENSEPIANVAVGQPTHISQAQLVQAGSHIVVPSSVGVGSGIALLHVDPTLPHVPIGHGTTGMLSTVDLTQLTQPLSLHKSVTSTEGQEISEPLSLQKHIVTQVSSPAATPTPVSAPMSMSTPAHPLEPISLHKTSFQCRGGAQK
ncbi:Zinc finger protein [Penaeus vannamei]|uniref:Zinc finger protein n=1 Tax=Penaeus vannamei TaxID=6689 RepID=A0A3R7PCD1_PENVA|nr:Zinc finger protein [Penaeus vannamei]